MPFHEQSRLCSFLENTSNPKDGCISYRPIWQSSSSSTRTSPANGAVTVTDVPQMFSLCWTPQDILEELSPQEERLLSSLILTSHGRAGRVLIANNWSSSENSICLCLLLAFQEKSRKAVAICPYTVRLPIIAMEST